MVGLIYSLLLLSISCSRLGAPFGVCYSACPSSGLLLDQLAQGRVDEQPNPRPPSNSLPILVENTTVILCSLAEFSTIFDDSSIGQIEELNGHTDYQVTTKTEFQLHRPIPLESSEKHSSWKQPLNWSMFSSKANRVRFGYQKCPYTYHQWTWSKWRERATHNATQNRQCLRWG